MNKKYRKKPVIIEAIQWNGKNLIDVSAFLCNQTRKEALKEINSSDISFKKWDDYESIVIGKGLTIDTLEGRMKADIGDYIIKGINGEFYPCKPDIFQKIYEAVEKTPCHSYRVGQRGKYIFNPITGKNEYTLVSYGFCLGTKECEECNCEGDKSKCDFY